MIVSAILVWVGSSCSGSKFKAESPTSPPPKQAQNATPQPYVGPLTQPDEVCPETNEYDPNEMYSFTGAGEMNELVNSRGGFQIFSGAALSGDNATAAHVCKLKGYQNAENIRTGKFHSCEDNMIIYWTGTGFNGFNACVRNVKLQGVDCKGKNVRVDCNGNRLDGTGTDTDTDTDSSTN